MAKGLQVRSFAKRIEKGLTMNFKKIELVGFKSFADKLEIKFDEGITGIVGPNGCGKSNVSDAIRWVLGEQSTKLLRSSNMQEVIFNGTEKRKSMSYCEVSLFFDNTSRMFDLNFDEVAFTRKLYRSGESEYLINGTPCRMKDIVNALHDSGIGKEGYSIIGQGKVEEIISAKPENRRAIFEEAAGIAKFKQRKLEAERKLDRTQENLNRALDVLQEQERQLGPLKRQAENAKLYLGFKEELKSYEVNVYVSQYESASDTKQAIQTKIDGFEEELTTKQASLDKMNNDYDAKMGEVSNIDRTLQQLNDTILTHTVELEKKTGEANVVRERLKFLTDEMSSLKEDLSNETLNRDNSIKLIEANEQTKEEKEAKLKALSYRLEDLTEQYLKIVDELTGAEDEATEKQKKMIDELSKMTDIKSNISALNAQREAYQSNITDLDGRIYALQNRIKEKESALSQATQISRNAQDIHDKLNSQAQRARAQLQTIQDRIKENNERIAQTSSNIQILQNRKKVLEDMQKDYDGFNYSVKRLMQDAKSKAELKSKIVDIVASAMTIPKGFETAIEVALGGAVQDVITKNEEDAKYLINYLKHNNYGRATFLPITAMKVRLLSDSEKNIVAKNKTYGVASSVVKFDPSLRAVFESLLGRTVVVDTIDTAVSLARQSGFTFKIVTLDGDVVSTQGSMSGGSKKAVTSNLLTRDNEIQNLTNQIAKLTKSFEEFRNLKSTLETELSKLTKIDEDLQSRLVVAQVESAKQAQNLEQLSVFVDELNKERIALSQEKIDFTAKIEVISKAIASVEGNVDLTLDGSEQIENNQKLFVQLRTKRDELQNEITELKIEKTTLENELSNITQEIARLDEYIDKANFNITDISANIAKIEESVELAQEMVDSSVESLDDDGLKAKIDDAKSKLASLDQVKQNLQYEIRKLDEDKARLMGEISLVQEKKYQQTTALAKVDTDIEAMQEKIFEDYELTYASCLPLKVENFDLKQGLIEISRLKKEISKLGYINVNAIEDCKELMARYEELSAQANDLTTAKEDLEKIIKDLSEEMITRFDTEFAKIQANFSKSFRELFGGGNAKLELTESEDPLQAGVEIVAEPPGKKLQSITLLSGGEKALTAIAILFAILRLRPMPFCLLDEIEAALDDSNVSRFAQYLKNFSKETQFIVITHRKPTMMLADSLYGVTMEERGVSKIVSVKLADAIKNSSEEQNIKTDKTA
ncbi:MAG: chromosome segregation protein SMC [Christensenellales bacterium]